jgi:3-hydroxyacyl-CoA dehydrogenase
MNSPVSICVEDRIALIVIDNPPVNASSAAVRRGLMDALLRISTDAAILAGIIIGARDTFIAGSDIAEFGKPLPPPELPDVIRAVEFCAKPIVAAIAGAAFGGGFELALGCDARVASGDALVGLPEVSLGMIPGAGGTQRLPRIVGIASAIDIICSSRRIGAEEAHRLGILDLVVDEDLRTAAIRYARMLNGRKQPVMSRAVPQSSQQCRDQAAQTARSSGRNGRAVSAAIDCILSAETLPPDRALAAEREVFTRLRNSHEAAALRYLFFAERLAAKFSAGSAVEPLKITRVGVVGAGLVGSAIAACFADAGIKVTLVDLDRAALDLGLARIERGYERLLSAGKLSADERGVRLEHISPTTDLSQLQDADLIVEAFAEDLPATRALFAQLEPLAKPSALIASTMSDLDLNLLAASTRRPNKIVGLHFINPAQSMRLLEIVRGAATSPVTLASALALAKRLKKIVVVANGGRGFIGNRIDEAYRRQCEFMLEEGSYPEDIDTAMQGFGFRMGPFAVADKSGLDSAWNLRRRVASGRDPKIRYVRIADELCEAGRFGKKAGAGWYRYPTEASRGEPDPVVRALIDAAAVAKGLPRHALSAERIVFRALTAMVNEAALVLEEGVAARASDIDVAMVHGYGFPSSEGGPLFWAMSQERSRVLTELAHVASMSGFGFREGPVERLLDSLAERAQ